MLPSIVGVVAECVDSLRNVFIFALVAPLLPGEVAVAAPAASPIALLLTHFNWNFKFQNQLGADIMKSKSEWKFEINIGVFALIVAARCDSQRGRCSRGGSH